MTDYLCREDDVPEKMSDDIIRFFLENTTQENEEIFTRTLSDDFIFHGPAFMSSNFLMFDFKLNKLYFRFDSDDECNDEEEVTYIFAATFDKFKKLRELSDNFDHLKEHYKLYGERVVNDSIEKLLEESNRIIAESERVLAYFAKKREDFDQDEDDYIDQHEEQLRQVPENQRALYEQFLRESGPECDD